MADGDFDIPVAYCTDAVGADIAARAGKRFEFKMEARRIAARASNVIARLRPEAASKIVVTAHLDAYEDSSGAADTTPASAGWPPA